uniref:Large ribosomal subunit protein mL40 n=1 Tax=Candida glabrata TaxID=5478 RepID=Q8TFL6_CANGB|nr:mitochondrial ribosomal protein MRPL28 [Nakaseomyces glabratus]
MLRNTVGKSKTSIEQLMAKSQIVRYKRTKSQGGLSPLTQRVVTQLSVLSAARKRPKLLKLSKEDLVKHQTIERSWKLYQQQKTTRQLAQLKQQYLAMEEAMETLKSVSPELYEEANISEEGKQFPLDIKITTDAPPNKIWHYNFKK